MSAAAVTAATPEVARFLQVLAFEHRTTLNVLKAVPADKLEFRPTPKNMTAGELAWHVATAPYHLATCVANGKFDLRLYQPAPQTLQEILEGAESCYQKTCETLAALAAEQLQGKIELPGGHRIPLSALLWNGVLFHTIHHRGQLTIYIRMMGGRVPSVYGPSGDENPYA